MTSRLLLPTCGYEEGKEPQDLYRPGPAATDSLERRGTLTSVSTREPVPQPDVNHADQNWDPGGGHIFIRDNHLYGAVVASMNGVGDGPGDESISTLSAMPTCP
jgi:hypothetical protein